MIADAIIWLGILAAFLLILAVGGLIADYVFPLIPPLNHGGTYDDYEFQRRGRKSGGQEL